MAYAPAAITEFLDGNTPLTGTLALGSLFEAEFDQLYGNWNHFFGVAGNTLTIDGLESRTGTVVKVLGGVKVTTATSGVGATDGFNVDMDGSNNARLWNYENTDIVIGTNNTEMLLIDNAGNIGVRNGIPLYIYSAGNDKYLSLIHNDTDALISTNSGNIYTDKSFGIGVTPSNPLHVQSTTTPQFRIGYDAGSYATIGVADGGNLSITCGEATGYVTISPGAGLYCLIGNGAGISLTNQIIYYSSDSLEYGTIQHNGSNLVIGTGGTNAGNIVIANTTECTGAGTGALQVSGGAYIAGNLVCLGGGDIATNCAMGRSALVANTTGYYNTAMGRSALEANTTGYSNTAIGHYAGIDLTTGHNVTCIGYNAQPSAADATNQVTLGDTSVGSLRCQVALTVLSDERDKTNIKPLSVGLDFINGLNPVSYNRDNRDWYKDKKKDGSKALKEKNIGLLAQEVMALEDKFDKTLGIVNREVAEKLEMTYEKFIPIIIKAIQELSEKIDSLKN